MALAQSLSPHPPATAVHQVPVPHKATPAAQQQGPAEDKDWNPYYYCPLNFLGDNQNLGLIPDLLLNTCLTGKEIAYELGFETPSYFYEVFRQHEGISPSTYREENLGDRNPHR
ncbi:MAG: helix-turn-helix domain-containing protein [Bacteroidaceae bacterium]|nr:helix-turn-helix domain-containing protein [Bacteroidaceae bacterium]